jgi:hypothetical protein
MWLVYRFALIELNQLCVLLAALLPSPEGIATVFFAFLPTAALATR